MINLKKEKIVLENDLQFIRKENEDALTAYIEVVFNGHKIGDIRHTVRAKIIEGRISSYDYFYNYFSYNNAVKITWEYQDLSSLKKQIEENIEEYIKNVYLLFNIAKPEVKIDEVALFDNSEREFKKLSAEEAEAVYNQSKKEAHKLLANFKKV